MLNSECEVIVTQPGNLISIEILIISYSHCFLAPTGEVGELDQPTNLLATFIEYASIITHDVRGE